MKRIAHLTINGSPFCSWSGCQAGRDKQVKAEARDPGVKAVCGHGSLASANRAARALRPEFRRGMVKVVPGDCPAMTAPLG